LVIATRHIQRFDYKKPSAELDRATLVLRVLNVDDQRVERIARIDLHVRRAEQSLVRPGFSPIDAIYEQFPLLDLEPDEAALPWARKDRHGKEPKPHRQQNWALLCMTLHDSSLPSGCPDALEVSRGAAAVPRLAPHRAVRRTARLSIGQSL